MFELQLLNQNISDSNRIGLSVVKAEMSGCVMWSWYGFAFLYVWYKNTKAKVVLSEWEFFVSLMVFMADMFSHQPLFKVQIVYEGW